jgi:hypothetical protein
MILEFNQPLTERVQEDTSRDRARPSRKASKPAAINEPIV